MAPVDRFVDPIWGVARDALDSDAGKSVKQFVGAERLESLKAGATSILGSLLAMIFVSVLDPDRLSPRWEFQLDMLALDVFLFGVVYRYAVRAGDDNPMLRAGRGVYQAK